VLVTNDGQFATYPTCDAITSDMGSDGEVEYL